MNFLEKLDKTTQKNDTFLCVGLDPDPGKIPSKFKDSDNPLYEFNKYIVEQTAPYACAFKPNSAFYEAYGAEGIAQLKATCDYINENYPDIPIILDFKRGDIGNTNNGYIKFAYEYLNVDAVTLHPYMGQESLQPFLDRKDKFSFILCKTSNEGSGEFQDVTIGDMNLSKRVAQNVANEWNKNLNCGLVAGGTYTEDLKIIREIVGDDITFLVPGIGAQGGGYKQSYEAGKNSEGKGVIISASRSVIYADNPAQAAQSLIE